MSILADFSFIDREKILLYNDRWSTWRQSVDIKKTGEAIQANEIFVDDPAFYERAFTFAAQQRKLVYARDGDNFKRVCAEEYNELSKRLDVSKFQESCAVRNV